MKRRENVEQTVAVNGTEYTILKLLGKGKGGYSYLALAEEDTWY